MLMTVSKLFEQNRGDRTNVIQNFYLSMFDISLETVRDFGKYYFGGSGINKDFDFSKISPDSLDKESAELLDNSSEAV